MNTKNSLTHTEQYKKVLAAVHMVYRLVNSTYNLNELLLRLTRLLCQFIHADSSSIFLYDPRKDKVIVLAVFDNKLNHLYHKKKDFKRITTEEYKTSRGRTIFSPRVIGLPLIADDYMGAVFVKRSAGQPAFTTLDKDMLAVVAEQSVTAIKNLQLSEEQQEIILSSMKFICKILETHDHASMAAHTSDYFLIVKRLAEKFAMSSEAIEHLYYASILHDAGAIDVPFNIMTKKSHLSSEELRIVRDLPARTVKWMKPMSFMKPVLPIILYHHEQYDGTGYPSGLKHDQIPLGARIMAVVDAFESMTTERPYKTRLSIDQAMEDLKRNSGTQFDPAVIDAFTALSCRKSFRKYLEFKN